MKFIIKHVDVKYELVKITFRRADNDVDQIKTVITNIQVWANAGIITSTSIVLLIYLTLQIIHTSLKRILLHMCLI